MRSFQIQFDRATKNWTLLPDQKTIPAPLVFASDGRGGGNLGLYGAISMAVLKGAGEGGEIQIRFGEDEGLRLKFEATGMPELATMEMGKR